MEAIAKTRHLKGSPRKARLVIDLIRGRNVSQALNILKFTDKRAAEPIEKTLRSAIANATYLAEQQNIAIDPDDLFVKTCFVDMGAHKNRRRMRPAPQGRAFREQRHYCHITILVSSDTPVETKSAKKSLQTAGEKGDSGAKSENAPKPKAAKKSEKVAEVKETKKAKAEKPEVAELVEENVQPVATSEVTKENVAVQEPVGEIAETEAPKVEVKTEAVEIPAESETEEAKADEVVEEAKESSDILDVDSPKTEAKAKTDKQKAEASDAKNVQSQTPAERNETKKADNAQLDENDILELQ